ncbi:methylthioribulose 1-phosphate dehydratase [Streptomyces ipomoeae]|uniref:Methylthioribulose-1-phosphate dehydratase n=2 Tax=Streptomyces ipomoeae TaxID=103232 RepID=L1L3H0_9ACTN|nr:methylthioribulose 1-phosphate dehydratase [Streptomyces ipomoeae]EKX67616.1 methylthioribulose-1-phosphate dehydratase [Streptomyces ipomoeae 91-03]MDX2693252.1 methylthioribulose 1-phosphate dehydratase [Streptomyces ipomoeae]MDX2824329.1 methylthioribulose 1-phosphate dehydratase [Streptomyces ipomoeae]MDX2838856.1 methylthioribulose 1-phosphate dehydratase [Streptomyces ipomoeae]MDX2876980.1 methylthioribulose 1-phosphate dehydratase [Streptomyces ipomoeae]
MTDGTFATDQNTRRLGDELALISARLYERGWMPGTSGNLSARLPSAPDRVLITASGRDKGELTAQDMVMVDAGTGDPVEPTALRASAETAIHAAVYSAADAQAVIHVHSPYATAVACRAGREAQTTLVRLAHFELLKGLSLADATGTDLPVFPNWAEVPRIAADVADYYGHVPAAPPGLLIAGHGITTWGKDLAQARNRLECLESICQLLVIGAGEIQVRAPD